MMLNSRLATPSPRLHVFRGDRQEAGASAVSSPGLRASVAVPLVCAGLLFDPGDVFFDETAWWRWMARLLSHTRPHWHYADLYRVWRNEYRSEVNYGCREYWDAVVCLLQSVGLSAAQTDEIVRASRPVQRRFAESVRLLPEVRATLKNLAQMGVPLGVLSHSPCSGQAAAQRLHQLGIGSYFQIVVSSADLGPAAIDGGGYAEMADALGAPADEVVMVGHDADDLSRAAGAGMPTIAVNSDPDCHAAVHLDRFQQLTDVVHRPASRRQAG